MVLLFFELRIMPIWIIAVIVIAVIGALLLGMYNGLVRRRNRVRESWSDIDVQLKRRFNLIPNLVDTVKGYAKHEREVFEKVTEARSAVTQATSQEQRQQSENMISDALKSLFAVSENYPDLKASTNFLELQRELADTENKIQAARRFYNSTVMDYNNSTQTVPTNIVAGMFGFREEAFFKVEVEEERNVPDVQF